MLKAIAADGRYTQKRVDQYRDGEGWAETKFFRAAELESECEQAGFTVERMVGLEGIASTRSPQLEACDAAATAMVEDVIQSMRTDPVVVDLSEHILAVCRPPCDRDDGG